MLDLKRITEVARDVALATFGPNWVEDVHVEPASDWTGADVLRVLVVLDPKGAQNLDRTNTGSGMLLALGDRLFDLGETRFPFLRFATQNELETSAGSES